MKKVKIDFPPVDSVCFMYQTFDTVHTTEDKPVREYTGNITPDGYEESVPTAAQNYFLWNILLSGRGLF